VKHATERNGPTITTLRSRKCMVQLVQEVPRIQRVVRVEVGDGSRRSLASKIRASSDPLHRRCEPVTNSSGRAVAWPSRRLAARCPARLAAKRGRVDVDLDDLAPAVAIRSGGPLVEARATATISRSARAIATRAVAEPATDTCVQCVPSNRRWRATSLARAPRAALRARKALARRRWRPRRGRQVSPVGGRLPGSRRHYHERRVGEDRLCDRVAPLVAQSESSSAFWMSLGKFSTNGRFDRTVRNASATDSSNGAAASIRALFRPSNGQTTPVQTTAGVQIADGASPASNNTGERRRAATTKLVAAFVNPGPASR